MKKNGFLLQVDILKWEKLKIAQEITFRLHYRGLLLLEYRRGIYLIVKVNQEKKSASLRILLSPDQLCLGFRSFARKNKVERQT